MFERKVLSAVVASGLGLWLAATAMAGEVARPDPLPNEATGSEAPEEVLGLPEAIRMALESNADLAAARVALEQGRARIVSAGARPNPEVGGELAPAVPDLDEWSLTLEVEQQIPIRGKIAKRIDLASVELEREEHLVRDLARRIAAEVRQVYRRAQLLDLRMALSRGLAEHNQRLLTVASARFAQGEVSELDVRQFEIELTRLRQEVESLAALRRSAFLELSRLLNRAAEAELVLASEIAGPLEAIALEPFLEQAVGRAEVKALDKESEAGEREAVLFEAEIWSDPVVGLFTSVERDGFEGPPGLRETDFFLGARFKISLPYRYKNQGEIAAAQARTRTAQALSRALKVTIDRQVRDAHQRALAQLGIVLALEQGIAAADQARQLAEEAYSQGLINAVQQLQTQQQFFAIRDARLDALEEYYEALSDLEGTTDVSTTGATKAPTQTQTREEP